MNTDLHYNANSKFHGSISKAVPRASYQAFYRINFGLPYRSRFYNPANRN